MSAVDDFISSDADIRAKLLEYMEQEGIPASSTNQMIIDNALRSSDVRAFIKPQSIVMKGEITRLIESVFRNPGAMDEAVARIIADTGVFSVSEVADNQQLWDLYASSGSGFVAGLNTSCSIFKPPSPELALTNLFRKVRYVDEDQEYFLETSLLFFAKNKEWQFEREWRMLRKLSEADLIAGSQENRIHLVELPEGAIVRVVFGYKFEEGRVLDAIGKISAIHPGIRFQRARIEIGARAIRFQDF